MATTLRIGSLNLRAYPNPGRRQIHDLAWILAEQECDVVLLQECLRPWLGVICETCEMTGVHAHELSPTTQAASFSPDGCAVAFTTRAEIGDFWRIAPDRFTPEAVHDGIFEPAPADFQPLPERLAYRSSGRSILGELCIDGQWIVIGSFHATPGSGRVGGVEVGEWKPFFHGAVALEPAGLEGPFVFGIDANEPLAETADLITFHWAEGRSGVEKIKALLGVEPLHRGRDLFREWLSMTGGQPASPDVLTATYAPSATFQRRFDSIWATSDFEVEGFSTHLENVVAAGGDHAMLVADLELRTPR